MDIRKLLIVVGVLLVAAGLLWPWLSRLGLGRLPGDIAVQGRISPFISGGDGPAGQRGADPSLLAVPQVRAGRVPARRFP